MNWSFSLYREKELENQDVYTYLFQKVSLRSRQIRADSDDVSEAVLNSPNSQKCYTVRGTSIRGRHGAFGARTRESLLNSERVKERNSDAMVLAAVFKVQLSVKMLFFWKNR